MIKLRIQPTVGSMTLIARCGEARGQMVRIGRTLKFAGVTGVAVRRHRFELAVSRSFVARVAVHGCMSAGQRETVGMLLYLLDRDLPSANGMTLFAIGSKLTFVNVGVAILTALSDVGEDRLDVALRAGHRLVHSTQWITCLVVIELGDGADGFPGVCRVAVLAWNVQVSMRTISSCRALGQCCF